MLYKITFEYNNMYFLYCIIVYNYFENDNHLRIIDMLKVMNDTLKVSFITKQPYMYFYYN